MGKLLSVVGVFGALQVAVANEPDFPIQQSQVQRQAEKLDRGLLGIHQGNDKGVFLSWRLLGTESTTLGFNVYRQTGSEAAEKLNDQPLLAGTHFIDRHANLEKATAYFVRAIEGDREAEPSKPFPFPASPPAKDYLSIPLQTPSGYVAGDASPADLDGDGAYEMVVHMTGRGRDNSQSGFTDEPILHAYKLDGTLLWAIHLGKNIREGAHYTQFMVYDLDGDGKAEVVCKTADGTIDGVGKAIGDATADHRQQPPNDQASRSASSPRQSDPRVRFGYVLKGPEYLTVFNGSTGAALATVPYVPQRHPETDSPTPEQMAAIWGDNYGNRIDRFLACVAYLDGERPSVILCRGYYTRTVLVAWDWRDGKLTQRWLFDSDQPPFQAHKNLWQGQGNHSLIVGDVDEDGKDEVVYGAMVIDDDGTGLSPTFLAIGERSLWPAHRIVANCESIRQRFRPSTGWPR